MDPVLSSAFPQPVEDPLVGLRAQLQGEVILPDDARYTEASQPWNLAVQQGPAVIVVAVSPQDVSAAVRYARSAGLAVAVMATGHGTIRPANGCLLLVTALLSEVRVDPARHTARIQAGTYWSGVLEKTLPHGLAPLLGSAPEVGAVGYTLGGGLGWLARKYGAMVDSVLSFQVVTADGEIVTASSDEHSDLYWGLRGGGGGFGVVTEMEIRLFPVDTVYGGNLFYPIPMARDVIRRYREWIATLPEEMTSSVVLFNFPPIPAVPEPLRGQSFVIVRGLYCGNPADGAALVNQWREWRTPAIDMFGEMPFAQIGQVSSDPVDAVPAAASGAWLRDLSDDVVETLVQAAVPAPGRPPALTFLEVRHMGGAVQRVDPHACAFGQRQHELLLEMVALTPSPEAHTAAVAHVHATKMALQPALGGVYMNFVEGEEAVQRTREGYLPEAYEMLRALKAKYDPENLFRFSYDIPPATQADQPVL